MHRACRTLHTSASCQLSAQAWQAVKCTYTQNLLTCDHCVAGDGQDVTYDVFLSHAGEQQRAEISILHERLIQAGFTVFLDTGLVPGGQSEPTMIAAAESAKVGLVLLTEDFVKKQWPMKELAIFLKQSTLLPLFYGLTVEQCDNPDKSWWTAYASQVFR